MDPFNIYIYIMIFPTEKQHCSGGANLQPSRFKNIHLNQMPLPKVGQTSGLFLKHLGFIWSSQDFLVISCHYSLPLIHATYIPPRCSNFSWEVYRVLVVSTSLDISSWNCFMNCHAQLQHSYHLLLYEKIPPPVHLRSLLHSFYQGIMVFLPCGPKNITCSLSPPLVNLLFRTPTATEGVANDGWVKRFMSSLSSGGCLRLTSLACQLSRPGGDAMEMMNRSRR